MRFYYLLTTKEPVIVSRTTATANNHESLDHIPGSAILGTVASELYPQLSADDHFTWAMFHSGQVQFGPCYPLLNDQIGLPVPASWHFEKGEQVVSDGHYSASALSNHSSGDFTRQSKVQYKQCRNGFVSSKGQASETKQGITTKTALDRNSGSVKQGSLFSYHCIDPGQTFAGWVECETEQQLELVRSVLDGDRHIGRSRSAEFGLVHFQAIEVEHQPQCQHSDELLVWCLSDCEVFNHLGQPTLTPTLNELVPNAQGVLDASRSFIRATQTSRYNQARRGIDSQQSLIAKGSVLVFQDVTLTPEQANQMQVKGVGINRQNGHGWVALNPNWNTAPNASAGLFAPILVGQPSHSVTELKAETAFTHWLNNKIAGTGLKSEHQEQANTLAEQILKSYLSARRYNYIHNGYSAGPSNTQWGRVREIIKNNSQSWYSALFQGRDDKTSQAVCKSVNDEFGWGLSWQTEQGFINFADFCADVFANQDRQMLLLLVEKLSRYDLSVYQDHQRACQQLLGETLA